MAVIATVLAVFWVGVSEVSAGDWVVWAGWLHPTTAAAMAAAANFGITWANLLRAKVMNLSNIF